MKAIPRGSDHGPGDKPNSTSHPFSVERPPVARPPDAGNKVKPKAREAAENNWKKAWAGVPRANFGAAPSARQQQQREERAVNERGGAGHRPNGEVSRGPRAAAAAGAVRETDCVA